MVKLCLYGLLGILFFLSLIIYGIVILTYRKEKTSIIKLDEYTTNFFITQLNNIIQYKAIYYIDSTFGNYFSNSKQITNDIDNEEIIEAHKKIIEEINNSISFKMKTYLIDVYGEQWLNDYVRIESLSLVINYTDKTIRSLTIEKFNS